MGGKSKRVNREHLIQKEVFDWNRSVGRYMFPELRLLHSITSGQPRWGGQLKYYKDEGLETGFPDIHLPVARLDFSALWIEMKAERGTVREDQRERIQTLRMQGNLVVVRRDSSRTIQTIIDYLLYKEIEDAYGDIK